MRVGILGCWVASMMVSSAATTVQLANFRFPSVSDNGLAFADNAGNPLSRVPISIGTYVEPDLLTEREVFNAFSPVFSGHTNLTFFDQAFTFDSSPVGEEIYFMFGDPNLAFDDFFPSDLAIFKADEVFPEEEEFLGAAVFFNLVDLEVVYGQEASVDTSSLVGPFAAFTNGFSVSVPEPSAVLLLGLGIGVGVVRRRRVA